MAKGTLRNPTQARAVRGSALLLSLLRRDGGCVCGVAVTVQPYLEKRDAAPGPQRKPLQERPPPTMLPSFPVVLLVGHRLRTGRRHVWGRLCEVDAPFFTLSVV